MDGPFFSDKEYIEGKLSISNWRSESLTVSEDFGLSKQAALHMPELAVSQQRASYALCKPNAISPKMITTPAFFSRMDEYKPFLLIHFSILVALVGTYTLIGPLVTIVF